MLESARRARSPHIYPALMLALNARFIGRWHDNRHTLITELAESGAGDQTIMDIAGHVSKQMLSHLTHIRTEAKRDALETVARRRRSAVEKL